MVISARLGLSASFAGAHVAQLASQPNSPRRAQPSRHIHSRSSFVHVVHIKLLAWLPFCKLKFDFNFQFPFRIAVAF
jgi:hypothetical protein